MATLNPFQLISMVKQAQNNPEMAAKQLVNQMMPNNPMMANLIQLAQSGNQKDVLKIAEQLFNQNGMNFNNEFSTFMNMMK